MMKPIEHLPVVPHGHSGWVADISEISVWKLAALLAEVKVQFVSELETPVDLVVTKAQFKQLHREIQYLIDANGNIVTHILGLRLKVEDDIQNNMHAAKIMGQWYSDRYPVLGILWTYEY